MLPDHQPRWNPTRRPVESRSRQLLPAAVDQRLLAYAVMAGAGLAMAAQPAAATILYTPANDAIPSNSTLSLDLDHDGVSDFTLINFATNGTDYMLGRLVAEGAQTGNKVLRITGGIPTPGSCRPVVVLSAPPSRTAISKTGP